MSGVTITALPPALGLYYCHTNELRGRPAPWWFVLARNLGHAGWKAANEGPRRFYRRYGEQSARQQLADIAAGVRRAS